ncbi:hypothetical protein Tsubulata_024198 [Turnera subulata]|uniref:Uncharacterized protein n=1 Tax=Turnera subulata TaxID=218843 RepID=A0A9Q0FX71_9ROSI|nr:hypothetical protein Tsubulata_024198 [Turnera subulata]
MLVSIQHLLSSPKSFHHCFEELGNGTPDNGKEVNVQVTHNGKSLNLSQLQKACQDSILEMHDKYDKEIDAGEDEAILIPFLDSKTKKSLHISSDGGAWILCRPLGVENGCVISMNDGIARLDIGGSSSLPISVIDSGKCIPIGDADWDYQLQKHKEKAPTMIELLSAEHCQQMEVNGGFPDFASVTAGEVPMNIVAVVRPSSYVSSSTLGKLDQKYIVKNDSDMSIVITFRREADDGKTATQIYSARASPSSCEGVNDFYIFSMGGKLQTLFQRTGVYMFLLSIVNAGKWKLLGDKHSQHYSVRLGCAFPALYIARFDIYDKQIPIQSLAWIFTQYNYQTLGTERLAPRFGH